MSLRPDPDEPRSWRRVRLICGRCRRELAEGDPHNTVMVICPTCLKDQIKDAYGRP